MQLFSADAIVFFKKNQAKFFDTKNMKKTPSIVAHNQSRPFYFTVQPRPKPTTYSPEFIFYIMKSRDQTFVLLSVP